MADYREARARLDALVGDAEAIAGRFERFARGLATPQRQLAGAVTGFFANPVEWERATTDAVPSIEQLTTLVNDVRATGLRVKELSERLILMGRAELVEPEERFFE